MDGIVKLIVKEPCTFSEAGSVIDHIKDELDNVKAFELEPKKIFFFFFEADFYKATVKKQTDSYKIVIEKTLSFDDVFEKVEKALSK